MEAAAYHLPYWVEWAKALGLPALALSISILSFLVSRWQVRISREKLKHDLFERRYALYEIYANLIYNCTNEIKNDRFVDSRFDEAFKNLSKIRFLFDKNLDNYIKNLVDTLHSAYFAGTPKKRNTISSSDYYYSQLGEKFFPFLKLDDLST
jgi:hypothetical protein